MPNVFISYVRENAEIVDRLADELRLHGVTVWLDRDEIMPGADWQYAIRQAIRAGDYFIACFSAEYVTRRRTYMNTEIGLAIEALQEMPEDRIWYIPVMLSDCVIPDRSISGGQTLRSLQWEPLHQDWDRGIRRILKAMGIEKSDILVITKPVQMELVRVPAGEFRMGSDIWDEGSEYDEGPQSYVYLPEYYIGKYPVTVDQFEDFVEATAYVTNAQFAGFGVVSTSKGFREKPDANWRHPRGPKSSVKKKGNHPVTQVAWDDALAFCQWLGLWLPTEAEWEKAARGVEGQPYPWGNDHPTAELCNFRDSMIGDTTPVDRYPSGASPYGALGMAGNVFEWCGSLYKPYPYRSDDGRDTLEAYEDRVLRGGAFNCEARSLRCAYRISGQFHVAADNAGFRVCAAKRPNAQQLREDIEDHLEQRELDLHEAGLW